MNSPKCWTTPLKQQTKTLQETGRRFVPLTRQSLNHMVSGDVQDIKSTVHMNTNAHSHTHVHIHNICMFFCFSFKAKILSIPETMHSFIQGLLNEDIRKEWTFEEQRNTTENKTKKNMGLNHGTNMEIWRGCCNQSLESSAFRRVSPPNVKLEVKLSLN